MLLLYGRHILGIGNFKTGIEINTASILMELDSRFLTVFCRFTYSIYHFVSWKVDNQGTRSVTQNAQNSSGWGPEGISCKINPMGFMMWCLTPDSYFSHFRCSVFMVHHHHFVRSSLSHSWTKTLLPLSMFSMSILCWFSVTPTRCFLLPRQKLKSAEEPKQEAACCPGNKQLSDLEIVASLSFLESK